MIRRYSALVVALGLCALIAACQARQDIEDDQASGDDRAAAMLVAYPGMPGFLVQAA